MNTTTLKHYQRNKRLRDFILDARAFIEYGFKEGMDNTAILHNLAHDIYGLAANDDLMLPRVDGYEKAHPYKPENGGLGDSSRGALLPILNSRKAALK